MKYTKLLDTIKELINYEPKQSEFCKILNLSRSTMSNRVKNDSNFTDEELYTLEKHYGISITSSLYVATLDCIDIDFYKEVKASCGYGCVPLSETSEKITVSKTSIPNYTGGKKYSVIVAQGNSMLPNLVSGDKLIIEHTDDNTIVDDNLYVFTYEGQVYVKRLVKNVNELVIKSDNPDKETYRTQYISKDDMNRVNIIGKCIGLMREKV